jgi:putative SOS response-associated peptidase YedK
VCGRFAFFSPKEAVLAVFGVELPFEPEPRYNIAPTQYVVALRAGRSGPEGVRLRWGLVPFWARDAAIGNRLINARVESLDDRPAFREAYRRRRCLVLASGFYEWRRAGSVRIPHYIAPPDGRPIAFAGLWERWAGAAEPLETCTIVTTQATPALRDLHDRMPLILAPEAARTWLDPGQPAEVLATLLREAPGVELAFHPVSRAVNSPANEGPALVEPAVL